MKPRPVVLGADPAPATTGAPSSVAAGPFDVVPVRLHTESSLERVLRQRMGGASDGQGYGVPGKRVLT